MLYTRNAKSPRTCSHGYCRGHLFWVGKILKRGGCGEGPRRAQRKARKRPSPSLLDEKVQKLTADFGAGEHECLKGLNGWNGIHCRNLNSKPQRTQRVTEGCDNQEREIAADVQPRVLQSPSLLGGQNLKTRRV